MDSIIVVDTDVLIDAGRSDKTAVKRLESEEKTSILGISSITQMELMVGCRNKKELNNLDIFLKRFTILSLDADISEIALELLRTYRLSHNLLIADSLIAATALFYRSPLLTKNQKDYGFIKDLLLPEYP